MTLDGMYILESKWNKLLVGYKTKNQNAESNQAQGTQTFHLDTGSCNPVMPLRILVQFVRPAINSKGLFGPFALLLSKLLWSASRIKDVDEVIRGRKFISSYQTCNHRKYLAQIFMA